MSDWPTNMTFGGVEKGVYMRINLRDYRKCNAKVQIQRFQWNVRAKTLIRHVSTW